MLIRSLQRTVGFVIAFIILGGYLPASRASTIQCPALDEAKRLEVSTYVMAKYHIESRADFTLESATLLDDSCFRKLVYNVSNRRDSITIYLAPDGVHLLPNIWDLRKDPAQDERAKQLQVGKALQDGAEHTIGPANAPVTIVEFSDFECPYCRKMADVLRQEVLNNTTGQVRFIYRNFPLTMHPWAFDAARMAECASRQNPELFWKAHDALFEMQHDINVENLEEKVTAVLSADASINAGTFKACLDQHLTDAEVNKDAITGRANGVHATPTLFINGVMVQGTKSASELQNLIQASARIAENSKITSNSTGPVPSGGVQ
jgi:protein-disulfide isomerase